MGMPWYEWGNIRKKLIYFGRAVQGVSPYKVFIEPDPVKCPSGYCDFKKREIAVNPSLFSEMLPKDQYQITKALIVHEAGHRRFTVPKKMTPLVHQVANILEDERIERQMRNEFAGIRGLMRKLSKKLYSDAETIDEKSDQPGEVVAYFLQLRWAKQIGKPVKGNLSLKNQKLWQKIKPLVYESWSAENCDVVYKNAERIVHILGIKEITIPEWVLDVLKKLGKLEGKRLESDAAEKTYSAKEENSNLKKKVKPEPFDGEVPPNDSREGSNSEAIIPKPYLDLEERTKHYAKELIEELSFERKPLKPEPVERGGKLSVRDYLRDKNRPFLSDEALSTAPPSLNLKIIVDHSASLNYRKAGETTRIESIAQAVMTLHLVCLELNIPHEVIVTPQQIRIADLTSGERGKALIAGLVPALCGFEDMGKALKIHALPMVDCPEDIKLVLCLTDGACNDAELGKKICRPLRNRVEVIGILLDPDNHTKSYLINMFGVDRVIACIAQELPQKLGNVLRAIRGI